MSDGIVRGSFRDPSGFVFFIEGNCYRQVNLVYKENYDFLISSGLYKKLADAELLIRHEEVNIKPVQSADAYKILKPELIPFLSYPYEWSFSQLKDASLVTLNVQKIALDHGMSLKDASAYNIQFYKGKPILIDTLSFEKYREGKPWVAYRQYCQHFLATLALMSCKDVRLNQLLRDFIDGIPLDLASSLLPRRTYLKPSLLMHIHLHAKYQKRWADNPSNGTTEQTMTRQSLLGLIDSLESFSINSNWNPKDSAWKEYYSKTDHLEEYLENKIKLAEEFLNELNPETVWDLGANTGVCSRIAADRGIQTVSFDLDPACVEINYRQTREKKEKHILPLVLDLNNPSPGIGWENHERMSLMERGPADTVFALALIHHLAISNNLPLEKIAGFFSRICRSLIIEFIPKSDSMVQKLLASREDIFDQYTPNEFEKQFGEFFEIIKSATIKPLQRTLYLMRKK